MTQNNDQKLIFHNSMEQCGGPKKSPRTSSIVQIIFHFWSFDISEDILRNQNNIISLDSYSYQLLIFGPIWIIIVFVSTILLKVENYSNFVWPHVANQRLK